jgi:hypothetical protein
MAIRLSFKTNIDKELRFVQKFPENLRAHREKIVATIARSIVRSAKRRAPVSTGTLKSNISWKKISASNIQIGVFGPAARYAEAQEFGFRPHLIPWQYMELHFSNPGAKGNFVTDPTGWVVSQRKQTSGFINPAFMAFEKRSNQVIKKMLDKLVR